VLATTADDLRRIAREFLDPEHASLIALGDPSNARSQLADEGKLLFRQILPGKSAH
jgi:hypothetical protein